MDNRLTKRRLSDFLAYEWIMTIIAIVAAILVWELIYTVSATRLSVGQQFKFYLDEDISSNYSVHEILVPTPGENGKTFSYEILSVDTEKLVSSYNVLSVRLSVQEGDAIFTSSALKDDGKVRAKSVADDFSVYDMNSLLNGAKEYLSQFTINGGNIYNPDDYDDNAIRAYFDTRMKGDKRFKTDAEKEKGRADEIARIKKLARDTKDFETILATGDANLFFRYVKYEQASGGDENHETFGKAYAAERDKGELIYGLNFGALTGGKKNVSEYLKISETDSAENVVLMLFDFAKYQPDLQFESISFTVTLVREFSDILG